MRLSGFGRVGVELVYSRRYQIELPGAATDPLRGERILAFLGDLGLTSPRRLHAPEAATYRQLRRVHSEDYIDSLLQPGRSSGSSASTSPTRSPTASSNRSALWWGGRSSPPGSPWRAGSPST